MAKSEPPRAMSLVNRLMSTAIGLGLPAAPGAVILTVRGRKSGEPRETPVSIVDFNGGRYITSPYGDSQWVQNLRAAGEASLRSGKRVEKVRAEELDPARAAPVLKAALAMAPKMLYAYYDTPPDGSLADFEREAPKHPVFQLHAQ